MRDFFPGGIRLADKFISKLKQLFEGDPAIRKVADDPVLTAELLLLFRMILADGVVRDAEIDSFKRICRDAFGIGEESFKGVVRYLHDFGYETSGKQAMSLFSSLAEDRKKRLVAHMVEIAKADAVLNDQEKKLLKRTLDMLGFATG